MTSILPPSVYSLARTAQAQTALTSAAAAARQVGPLLADAPDFNRIGIPEHNGPNTPDNPWYVGPDPTAPATGLGHAAILAEQGIGHIDAVLALGAQLSTGVRSALTNAREQAETGVTNIRTGVPRGRDTGIAPKFDAAALWLGMVRNLIQLENGGVVRPPITILPVNPPKPQPDFSVQLPSPDSPVQ